jgi:hypothetical protein
MAAAPRGRDMDEKEQRSRDAAVRAIHAAQAALVGRLDRLDASAARLAARWQRLEQLAAALELTPAPMPSNRSSS